MKYLLRKILFPLKTFFSNYQIRELYHLMDRYSKYPRFTEVNNVKFSSYNINIPDMASFLSQYKDIFVDASYHFFSDSKSPVILDCGSNIGMSILYFKKIYPYAQITGIEADPKLYSTSKLNLEKNGINDVVLINKAVWHTDNELLSFKADGSDGGAVDIDGKSDIKVVTCRLRTVLTGYKEIDLLKIDIEGAEIEVLNDCKDMLSNVKNIFIEYHSIVGKPQELSIILNLLEKNGFRYYTETVTKRKSPFIHYGDDKPMDLQVNIFGYKK